MNTMRGFSFPYLLTLEFVSHTGPVHAALVLFSQSPQNNQVAEGSNANGPQLAADNFSLTADSILTDIHWWGVYDVAQNTPDTVTDDFTAYFDEEDSKSLPGAQIASRVLGDIAGSSTSLVDAVGNAVYKYDALFNGVALSGSTTYFVSIVNDAVDSTGRDAAWFWAGSNLVANDTNWFQFPTANAQWFEQSFQDLAFELTGNPVPAPATFALIGFGLASIGYQRRKQLRGYDTTPRHHENPAWAGFSASATRVGRRRTL